MSYRIKFFPPAKADVADIRAWYRSQAPRQVPRFQRALRDARDLIAAQAAAYANQGGGLRSVGLKVFPYRVWFIPEGNTAVILTVIHTSRDPARIDARLQEYLESR
jgi:plasmid stabilization system protein ParE